MRNIYAHLALKFLSFCKTVVGVENQTRVIWNTVLGQAVIFAMAKILIRIDRGIYPRPQTAHFGLSR